jgi:Holliday junction DNA helicase RuvA
MFRHLISVSGIGPTTAQIMLSSLNPDELRAAIIGEQESAFRQVKGVGPKTAKRLILDLKDKLVKESGEAPLTFSLGNNTIREEALSALVALGFQRIAVQKTLNAILKNQPTIDAVETLIKLALRELSS